MQFQNEKTSDYTKVKDQQNILEFFRLQIREILKIHYLYYLSTSDDVQGPRNGLYLGEA